MAKMQRTVRTWTLRTLILATVLALGFLLAVLRHGRQR